MIDKNSVRLFRPTSKTSFIVSAGSVFVALILLISSFYTTNARAAQTADPAIANWNGGAGPYGINNNFSPQTAINASNISNLVPLWVSSTPVNPNIGDQGVINAPMIIHGEVYVLSQSQFLYSLNAENGKTIWSHTLPISYNPSQNVIDSHLCTGPINVGLTPSNCLPSGHYHDGSWAYTTQIYDKPLIWVDSNNYTIYAFDALVGDQVLKMNIYADPASVLGNYGFYDNITPQITIDEQDKVMVVGTTVADTASAGRGFFNIYSLATNPPTLTHQVFLMPPQNYKDPGWSLRSVQNMSYAWIFNGTGAVNLKELSPSLLNRTLYGDWGTMGFNGTQAFAGTGTAFGGPYAFDSNTHMMYIPTGNVSPDWNATFRPGPNLWSDSVLGISVLTGKLVWAFQSTAHDLWDYDCAWNVILANTTINGVQKEVVLKSCKNGYTYALDAATGQMYWFFTPRGQSWFKSVPNTILHNPLNATQMKQPIQVASYHHQEVIQNPGATGTPESNMAYDPVTNLLFVGDFNNPQSVAFGNVAPTPGASINSGGLTKAVSCPTCVLNTTIYALNANNGKVQWSYFIPYLGFRGGITATGGLVFVSGLDGIVRILNENTGALVRSINVGSAVGIQPAVGQTANGTQIIVVAAGVSEEFQGATPIGIELPGFVMALAVQPGGSPRTVTTTAVTTVTGFGGIAFYGVSAVAAVFIIVTVALLATRRRSAAVNKPR